MSNTEVVKHSSVEKLLALHNSAINEAITETEETKEARNSLQTNDQQVQDAINTIESFSPIDYPNDDPSTKPDLNANDGDISYWFDSNGYLQLLKFDSSVPEWVDHGDPVLTSKYGLYVAPNTSDKTVWQSLIDKAKAVGGTFYIPSGSYTISGDMLIDMPMRLYIAPGAEITIQDNPVIDYEVKNNQNASSAFAMFKFTSLAKGSVVECYGKLDMNGENSGTDSDGDKLAPIGVWAYQCHNFNLKGKLNVARANNCLSIIDSDNVTIDTVFSDEGTPRFDGGAVVVTEGAFDCEIDKIIAKNHYEAIDFNNENDTVKVGTIIAENCDEVVDINFSINIRIDYVRATNCRISFNAAAQSGARYSQRSIPNDGMLSIGDYYVFVDGSSSRDYSNTTALFNQTSYANRISVENVVIDVASDFTVSNLANSSTLPPRVALLSADRGNMSVNISNRVDEFTDNPIRFSSLGNGEVSINIRTDLQEGQSALVIGSGVGGTISSLYLRTYNSPSTNRTAIDNQSGNATHIASRLSVFGFDTLYNGKFSFGFPLYEHKSDFPDTVSGQEVFNRDKERPMWWNGNDYVFADGRTSVKGSNLTISSGSITVDSKFHYVDTEGEASTDELDTINTNVFNVGDELFLRIENSSRTFTIKHGVGNIFVYGGTDVNLDSSRKIVHLIYDENNNWRVLNYQS